MNIDEQKKRKRKHTSMFIKYLETAFLKATQLLQFVYETLTNSLLKATQPLLCDSVPWQSEAIITK